MTIPAVRLEPKEQRVRAERLSELFDRHHERLYRLARRMSADGELAVCRGVIMASSSWSFRDWWIAIHTWPSEAGAAMSSQCALPAPATRRLQRPAGVSPAP